MKTQVDKSHYQFHQYLDKNRWSSIWHQLDEVFKTNPSTVLEVGPGPGILKKVLSDNGIKIMTVDIDPELAPDFVASATELPFEDNAYDCVCAFQMLEHLPYEQALKAFHELVRVARKYIIISLPDAKAVWPYWFYIPVIGTLKFMIPNPAPGKKPHEFDGEHYWEINKKGFSTKKIKSDFKTKDSELIKSYRVWEKPYHHFFVFKKTGRNSQ